MNENIEPEEKSNLMQAVEKATHSASEMPIAEDGGKLFMSHPISGQNYTEGDISEIDKKSTTSFYDEIDSAVNKAKDQHDNDTKNYFPFVQEYNDHPEEP